MGSPRKAARGNHRFAVAVKEEWDACLWSGCCCWSRTVVANRAALNAPGRWSSRSPLGRRVQSRGPVTQHVPHVLW